MDKNRRWQIRAVLAVIFLILIPLKFIVLSVVGIETTGKTTSLSTPCENGIPVRPQARITAVFWIDGVEDKVVGAAGYGNPAFCNVNLGDIVKVTYIAMTKINYTLATIGDPKNVLSAFLAGGILINIVGNFILTLLQWYQARKSSTASETRQE
jgi:hypothetical protein